MEAFGPVYSGDRLPLKAKVGIWWKADPFKSGFRR